MHSGVVTIIVLSSLLFVLILFICFLYSPRYKKRLQRRHKRPVLRKNAVRQNPTAKHPTAVSKVLNSVKDRYKNIVAQYVILGLSVSDSQTGPDALGLILILADSHGAVAQPYRGYKYILKPLNKTSIPFYNHRANIVQRLAGTNEMIEIDGNQFYIDENPLKTKIANGKSRDGLQSRWICQYKGTLDLAPGMDVYLDVLDNKYRGFRSSNDSVTYRARMVPSNLSRVVNEISVPTKPLLTSDIESRNSISIFNNLLESKLGQFRMSSLLIPDQCPQSETIFKFPKKLFAPFTGKLARQFYQHAEHNNSSV
jgi:hypothetical protein